MCLSLWAEDRARPVRFMLMKFAAADMFCLPEAMRATIKHKNEPHCFNEQKQWGVFISFSESNPPAFLRQR
jgi:hypothetical protein